MGYKARHKASGTCDERTADDMSLCTTDYNFDLLDGILGHTCAHSKASVRKDGGYDEYAKFCQSAENRCPGW
jgi:hypothetical protein